MRHATCARLALGSLLVATALAPGCDPAPPGGAGAAPAPPPPILESKARPAIVPFADFENGLELTLFDTRLSAGDDSASGGVSTSRLELLEDGGANGSARALRVVGNARVENWPYAFAGVAFALGPIVDNDPAPKDLSSFHGLQMWVRGDAKHYLVRFHSDAVLDFDYHYYDFEAPREWTLVRIPFDELKQFDWGAQVPWSEASKRVRMAFVMNYSEPGESFGDFRLDLDDIALF